MTAPLSTDEFQEHVLSIMDLKHHWAWPWFAEGRMDKDQLELHFRQEYAVYVRDFPVLLARVYANNPPQEVRRLLAENIYEEDTGGLSLGRSHPELFLRMMEGLGYDLDRFRQVELLPGSRDYRAWLDDVSSRATWILGAAALTVLVEGSVNDRRELQTPPRRKSRGEIEDAVLKHPLVLHHAVAPEYLDLVRAHQMVEAGHRHAAYRIVLDHATTRGEQEAVCVCLKEGLALWLKYRDGVARGCGLTES